MQLASQQYDEIARCLPALFEAWPTQTSLSGAPRTPNNGSRIPEALSPWIAHLIELDGMSELLPAAGVRLTFEELKGLSLLRAARQKFLSEHERCRCGAVKRRGAFCPRGCKE